MTWCLCQAYPYTTATSTCLPGAVVHSLKSEYEKFLFEINFNKSKDWTLRNVAEKKGKRSSKLGRLRICISELSKQLIAAPTSLYTHACRVKGMSKEGSYPPPPKQKLQKQLYHPHFLLSSSHKPHWSIFFLVCLSFWAFHRHRTITIGYLRRLHRG